jgi:trehalose-phosphatase
MHHDESALYDRLRQMPPATNRPWLWVFDFDGTLVNIASHPNQVIVPQPLLEDLQQLTQLPGHTVAVISGRTVADLQAYFGSIPRLWLSGDHGAEVIGPHWHWVHDSAAASTQHFTHLAKTLSHELSGLPGVYVESKRYSLAIHYRLANDGTTEILKRTLATMSVPPGLAFKHGHQCVEIRPVPGPTKADAMAIVRNQVQSRAGGPMALVFGDDQTDEDMFKVAKREDITVRVASDKAVTGAEFQVDSPYRVTALIRWALTTATKGS